MRQLLKSVACVLTAQRLTLLLLTAALGACSASGPSDEAAPGERPSTRQSMVPTCDAYASNLESCGYCGDGMCAGGEDQWSCPEDCGGGGGYCGDGVCNGGESSSNCPSDCGPSTWCGDGICNGSETGTSCPADCGSASSVVLGRFSRWCGKVNTHEAPGGSWTTDSDCSSGCNIGGLAYCQKFWPGATSVRQVPVTAKPASGVWTNSGCGPVSDDYDGDDEFECLGAATVYTENVAASSWGQQKHGVAYYSLEEGTSYSTIQGYSADGSPLARVQWSGGADSGQMEMVASQGGVTVRAVCSTASGCVLQENGIQVTAEALSAQGRTLLTTVNDYYADAQGILEPVCSVQAYAKLSEGGRRFLNTVCYAAGFCSGFWPIGTAICGPTAGGCLLAYATGVL